MTAAAVARMLLRVAPLFLLAACSSEPTPEPTPVPTTFPISPAEEAVALSDGYLAAWAAGDFAAMHALLDPAIRDAYPIETFEGLHATFAAAVRASRKLSCKRPPR